jgi:hypothetical protein
LSNIYKGILKIMAKSYLLKFFKEKLLVVAMVGIITGGLLLIFFNQNILVNYLAGLLLGVMNFVLLTVGCELLMSMRPLSARVAHFVFWALRYAAIALFISYYFLHKQANIYAVIGGLLTMHISIFLSEMKRYLFFGKEG